MEQLLTRERYSSDSYPWSITTNAHGLRAKDCAMRSLPCKQISNSKEGPAHDLCLPDPRSWLRQVVTRSSITFPASEYSCITESIAGFATVLQICLWTRNYEEQFTEAPTQEQRDEEARRTSGFLPDENVWRPYDFGIKHGLLDPCRVCRGNRQAPSTVQERRNFATHHVPVGRQARSALSESESSHPTLSNVNKWPSEDCRCRWRRPEPDGFEDFGR
jgi:hypothetical protein